MTQDNRIESARGHWTRGFLIAGTLYTLTFGRQLVDDASLTGSPFGTSPESLAREIARVNGATITRLPPLQHPLHSGDVTEIRALHKIRYVPNNFSNFTWLENYNILKDNGHTWCSILRDNHACFGKRYSEILSVTTPYRYSKYNLLSFDVQQTRILAVGNSHLLELLYLPICATHSAGIVEGYSISKSNSLVINAESSKSMKSSLMLILDNDPTFASGRASPGKTAQFVVEHSFNPSHIVLGSVNINGNSTHDKLLKSCEGRAQLYSRVFPRAMIVCRCSEYGRDAQGQQGRRAFV